MINYLQHQRKLVLQLELISLHKAYGTAHVQVYKQTHVTHCALRNFACNSRVGLIRHEEYTTREWLLMSWKYLRVTPVMQFCTRE